MTARNVATGVVAIIATALLVVSAARGLERERENREREDRVACAQSVRRLAGCPAPAAPRMMEAESAQRREADAIAAQIVAACDRATRARLYVKACDSVVTD